MEAPAQATAETTRINLTPWRIAVCAPSQPPARFAAAIERPTGHTTPPCVPPNPPIHATSEATFVTPLMTFVVPVATSGESANHVENAQKRNMPVPGPTLPS